ncbi:peptide ABC transporter substrate-binding protein [Pradoshia sp.]|uniref:peptide ABC transporter substrate-binding protein n=1 Tax=Pradoshia sp. TaxID=2651281 RepID=UPI003F0E3580
MKAKKVSLFLVMILALSTFLAACSGDDSTSSKGGGSTEGVEQVLNVVESSEIPSMDTTLATDSVSFNVMNNVMEGLYRLGENDEVTDGVAEGEPEVSEDGKTYTFKLRKDAKWSNGDPVTAHDFVYAWQKAVNPDTGAQYAYMMYVVENGQEINSGKKKPSELGVKAIDDNTLEVKLANAVPYFKSLLSFGTFMPQNQKFVEEQGDKYGLEADTTIYNGPFTLSEWKHEESFKLSKNKEYWDKDTVKLETVNFKIVKDTNTAVNLYETGKIDRVGLSAEHVDNFKDSEEFLTEPDSSVFYLEFNQENEILANTKIRKALTMAFDKEAYVDTILNNGSSAAYYIVPKQFYTTQDGKDFRDVNGDMLKTNKDEAAKLWAEGLKELGKDKVELELLNYDSDSAKKTGEYLKEQMESVLEGFTLTISQQPFQNKLDLQAKGDFDISFSGWGPDYQDPMTFLDMFTTGNGNNHGKFSNAKYDKLIKDANTTLLDDLKARDTAMADAEKLLIEEEAVIAPIYQRGGAFLMKDKVKGLLTHSFGGDYSYKWVSIEE